MLGARASRPPRGRSPRKAWIKEDAFPALTVEWTKDSFTPFLRTRARRSRSKGYQQQPGPGRAPQATRHGAARPLRTVASRRATPRDTISSWRILGERGHSNSQEYGSSLLSLLCYRLYSCLSVRGRPVTPVAERQQARPESFGGPCRGRRTRAQAKARFGAGHGLASHGRSKATKVSTTMIRAACQPRVPFFGFATAFSFPRNRRSARA